MRKPRAKRSSSSSEATPAARERGSRPFPPSTETPPRRRPAYSASPTPRGPWNRVWHNPNITTGE